MKQASQHDCEALASPGKWETAPSEVTEQCQEYVDACLTMSCMCGFAYLCMWLLRLGFVVDLLSDPMMVNIAFKLMDFAFKMMNCVVKMMNFQSGLTTAAGALICTSQVRT